MSTGARHPRGPRGARGRSIGYVAALYAEARFDEWNDRPRARTALPFTKPADLRSPALGGGPAHRRTAPARSLDGGEALAVVERIVSDGFASAGLERPVFATVGAGSLLRRRAAHGVANPVSLALVEGAVVLVEGVESRPHRVPLPPVGALDARVALDASLVADSTHAAEWLLATRGAFRPRTRGWFSIHQSRGEAAVSDEVLDDLLRRTDALEAGLVRSYALADDALSRLPSGLEVSLRHARRAADLLDLAADGAPAEWAVRRLGPVEPEW